MEVLIYTREMDRTERKLKVKETRVTKCKECPEFDKMFIHCNRKKVAVNPDEIYSGCPKLFLGLFTDVLIYYWILLLLFVVQYG